MYLKIANAQYYLMRKPNDFLVSVSTLCFWCMMYAFQYTQAS